MILEAIWFVIGILLLIIWLIWKIVVTPDVVLTVATDKASYNRLEDVVISGVLTSEGNPVAGEIITGAIVLPGGVTSVDFSATTEADGSYAHTHPLTAVAPGGTYNVQVLGFGANASTTFHRINQNVEDVLSYSVPIYVEHIC